MPSAVPPAGTQSAPIDGPTLRLPEAKRLPANKATAYLEAPPPKRLPGSSDSRLLAQLTGQERPVDAGETLPWTRYFRSTDNRPIESLLYGTGPRRIAILGSLHGDQDQSLSLVQSLARHLGTHPAQLQGLTVLLIKTPNPDGAFAATPYNVRGVDLDRNFPSANWKSLSGGRAGNKPSSEAETRAIIRVLLDFEPQLVVHVKDSPNGSYVNVEGAVRPLGERVAEQTEGQVLDNLGAATSGSLEAYVTTKMNAAALTLLLPDVGSSEQAWNQYQAGLLTTLSGSTNTREGVASPARDVAGTGNPRSNSNDTTSRTSAATSRPESKPASGPRSIQDDELDEFPIAPSHGARKELPVPESGYLELPPSPGK